ncbi:MAG: hypothetical protein ACTS78_02970 [Arsenophonus sp. NC-WZS1-MAG3]
MKTEFIRIEIIISWPFLFAILFSGRGPHIDVIYRYLEWQCASF